MTDVDYDHDLPGAAAGKDRFPAAASSLRKNGYVILKGFPCKIVDVVAKDGQVSLTGIDIFTGKRYDDTSPSAAELEVPVVTRTEYILSDISDGYLSLMEQATGETDDVPTPDGALGEDIQRDYDAGKEVYVTVTRAIGHEAASASRSAESS